MASWTDSPLVQSLSISVFSVRFSHSGVGTTPLDSGPRSMPVGTPKPICRDQRWSGEFSRR